MHNCHTETYLVVYFVGCAFIIQWHRYSYICVFSTFFFNSDGTGAHFCWVVLINEMKFLTSDLQLIPNPAFSEMIAWIWQMPNKSNLCVYFVKIKVCEPVRFDVTGRISSTWLYGRIVLTPVLELLFKGTNGSKSPKFTSPLAWIECDNAE